VSARRLGVSVVLLGLAGCATLNTVQRAIEGPTAEEVWLARFVRSYGRIPTFDEAGAWRDQLDHTVADYLARHPAVGSSPRVSQFRFHRRVSVGMSKEEVTLLVAAPDAVAFDEAAMQAAARQFWPEIKQRAKEMWIYPAGWQLYFEGDRLVDMTVIGRRPIE
jgi:hypothetical protein